MLCILCVLRLRESPNKMHVKREREKEIMKRKREGDRKTKERETQLEHSGREKPSEGKQREEACTKQQIWQTINVSVKNVRLKKQNCIS